MTARDDLIVAISSTYSDVRADLLIDAFAHELAEKQRTVVEHPEDWHPIFVRAVNKAANLIDPETSS